jgi:hypothetical protein
MIMEVDSHTRFSSALLGREPTSWQELLTLYGALLAHGTDMSAVAVSLDDPANYCHGHLGLHDVAGGCYGTALGQRGLSKSKTSSHPPCASYAATRHNAWCGWDLVRE